MSRRLPIRPGGRGAALDRVRNERGAVLIAVALFLLILLCFAALGTEAGRWYLVRAELSKSVDAGALAGAKNLSNPYVDPKELAKDFCAENFSSGYLGTPGNGNGTVTFDATVVNGNKVKVDGHASAVAILGRVLGFDKVPVAAVGVAQMQKVEIMMVLDRSGSMAGQPIADLKVAAKGFLDYFQDTQTKDKVGLVSFATSVKIDRPLGTDFVAPMKSAIDKMASNGHTNSEDAIDQSNGPGGLTNQNGVPAGDRVQQFVIFFSDGRPNTIRAPFKFKGATYDATAYVEGNCDPGDNNQTNGNLHRPDVEGDLVVGGNTITARPTGDGIGKCGLKNSTRWIIFDSRPVPGHGATECSISDPTLGDHVCNLAATLAVQHAKELKDDGVIVYAIGLGQNIHTDFLTAVASSVNQVYIAPTSDELLAMFQKVAQDIKLRLVE